MVSSLKEAMNLREKYQNMERERPSPYYPKVNIYREVRYFAFIDGHEYMLPVDFYTHCVDEYIDTFPNPPTKQEKP